MSKFKEKLSLSLYKDDTEILNENLAKLLLMIHRTGSILSASKALNIPYTRAWEHLMKLENLLGYKVIEARRGGRRGGGAKLTYEGLKLINIYLRSYRKYFNKEFEVGRLRGKEAYIAIYYIGSDDILVRKLVGLMLEDGYRLETYYIGSLKGLAALILGEADLSGIHLYHPGTDSYNKPYIDEYSRGINLHLIKGFKRLQGFISREEYSLEEIYQGLFTGKLRFINRNPGSGTQIFIDHIFTNYMRKKNLGGRPEDYIKGYNEYVYTHMDVANKVLEGYADVGVCIKYCSTYYKLHFIPLKWEEFDFIVRKEDANKDYVKSLQNILKSSGFREMIKELDGYMI